MQTTACGWSSYRPRRGGLLVGRSIADIAQDLPDGADCQICAVYRNNRLIVPAPQTVIIEGDEILFAAAAENIGAVIPELRPKETSTRRIMIAGGGNIGYRLAKQLEHAYNVKIIECRPRRAEWIAKTSTTPSSCKVRQPTKPCSTTNTSTKSTYSAP
ncbi:potassium transporter peripheral membrane protein [Neisseria gonorrhoeae]|nr:potassium transporter peripheral membrane protein [Neisseria gonorrhoeae]